jgi:hypothetical protein
MYNVELVAVCDKIREFKDSLISYVSVDNK